MANRFIIGLLVVLLVLTGGIGYYSFSLTRQVDSLNERIAVFENEQSTQVQAVSDNLSALRTTTESGLSSLDTKVTGAQSDISALKSDISTAKDRLAAAEQNLGAVSSQVTSVDKRVAGAEKSLVGLSNSLIDAAAVYQKAVKATVRITSGSATAGSGFIYDTTGRVVTAYHVVKGLSPIYVMMYDGKVSRANIAGFCPFSDVAVLNLDSNPSVEPLAMADSGKITIGQSVIAIGAPGDGDNPLALRDTLTSGIVSQLNRYIDVEGSFISNLLQFDAAVNFGNSGGPLIDSQGKVVGVVNARIDPTQGDGIYWAISSNKVKRVADSIIAKGSFDYPLIGTNISDLTPLQVRDKSLDTSNGALVSSVSSGGPAAIGGILAGDIIISMDGIAMRNIAELTSYLGEFKSPGDITMIEVLRGTAKMKFPVAVGKRT